jgi:hypothetical protein
MEIAFVMCCSLPERAVIEVVDQRVASAGSRQSGSAAKARSANWPLVRARTAKKVARRMDKIRVSRHAQPSTRHVRRAVRLLVGCSSGPVMASGPFSLAVTRWADDRTMGAPRRSIIGAIPVRAEGRTLAGIRVSPVGSSDAA